MLRTKIAKGLLGGASVWALLAAAQAAHAQAAAPSTPAPAEVAAVVVTGSRIQNPSFASPTPLTTVGADTFQQVAPATVDDVLNQIPQFRPDSGPNQVTRNTGSISTSQSLADLRGLGAQRTLVLINGERPVPTNPQGTTSTSIIPLGLVDRVDVVTGGASAAYGSDAVAGVVNFILKDRLEGLHGRVFAGRSEQGDNKDLGVSLAGGFSTLSERLHVVAGLDYDDNKGVGNIYSRSWSAVEPGNSGNPMSFGAKRPAGMAAFGWANGVEYATQTPGGVINSAVTSSGAATSVLNQMEFNPDGTLSPLVRGPVYGNLMINSSSNHIATPIAQWLMKEPVKQLASLARATYDLNDDTQAFVQASYAHSSVFAVSQYHQTPAVTILANNPYLSPSAQALLAANNISQFTMGRVDTEWLGTSGNNKSTTVQASAGLKGKVFDRFHWDLSYDFGRSELNATVYGTREADLAAAEYAVRDASGDIVCGPIATNPNFAPNKQTNTIQPGKVQPGCTPLDPFGAAAPSAAAIAYVSGTEPVDTVMVRHDVAANISGPLFDLPAGPLTAAAGAEYRYDSIKETSDPLQVASYYSCCNYQPYSGSNDVKEAYLEADVPILSDMAMAKSLGLNAAIRYADYKTSGGATTWKVGLTYEPVASLRFRATRSRDIRAPSLYELYNVGGFSATGSYTNPFTGVAARLPQQASGNPSLRPEKADTTTVGVIYQPVDGPLAGARLSVDYYRIKVQDVIASVGATDIVQRCFQGVTTYCSAIKFDNSPFGISVILSEPFNQSVLFTDGVDIEAAYHHSLAAFGLPGEIEASFYANYLAHSKTTDRPGPQGVTTDYAGYQNSAPKWTATAFLNYHLDPFRVGLQARGFTSIGFSPLYVGPGQSGYDPSLPNSINKNLFPGLIYWNVNGSYDFTRAGDRFQLFANIDNLFDKHPPAYAIAAINLGGNPYDYVGRTYKVGLRFDF